MGVTGVSAQPRILLKTLRFPCFFREVGADGGHGPAPKIIENIMTSIVFGEVGGEGSPRPIPKIFGNICIFIVFGGGGGPEVAPAQPEKSLKTA